MELEHIHELEHIKDSAAKNTVYSRVPYLVYKNKASIKTFHAIGANRHWNTSSRIILRLQQRGLVLACLSAPLSVCYYDIFEEETMHRWSLEAILG